MNYKKRIIELTIHFVWGGGCGIYLFLFFSSFLPFFESFFLFVPYVGECGLGLVGPVELHL